MSLNDPLSCGFAKVFVFNKLATIPKGCSKNDISIHYKQHHKEFTDFFKDGTGFSVSYETYRRKFVNISPMIHLLGKTSSVKKNTLLETFCEKVWTELTPKRKQGHSLFECS